MEVFARTSDPKQVTDYLVEMLRGIENNPPVMLEIYLQGAFNWRQKVRRTSALFYKIDDHVLNLCYERIKAIVEKELMERANRFLALHGSLITTKKAFDMAIQDYGTALHEAETARKEEDALWDAAAAPRPGLTLEMEAEKLPVYPQNAGLVADHAVLKDDVN